MVVVAVVVMVVVEVAVVEVVAVGAVRIRALGLAVLKDQCEPSLLHCGEVGLEACSLLRQFRQHCRHVAAASPTECRAVEAAEAEVCWTS
jgi:hypothetical protein